LLPFEVSGSCDFAVCHPWPAAGEQAFLATLFHKDAACSADLPRCNALPAGSQADAAESHTVPLNNGECSLAESGQNSVHPNLRAVNCEFKETKKTNSAAKRSQEETFQEGTLGSRPSADAGGGSLQVKEPAGQ
jgi:hypothetical protein